MRNVRRVAAPILALAFTFLHGSANAADDRAALSGLKEVKAAFDIKEGDPKALLNRLNIIDETRRSLIAQGVAPHFVLAFRGPATRLLQTDAAMIKPEYREQAVKVAEKVKQMTAEEGVDGFELCAVAVRGQGTEVEKVLPQIHVVGNGFISLMAYQAKGYAYIAP
jgi:intracellular sulfur oxidation DsrE/DsrF family protein